MANGEQRGTVQGRMQIRYGDIAESTGNRPLRMRYGGVSSA